MANINWYPGHMTKSIRMIEENIRLIDCLVYVLDARAPRSCINPDFERYILRLPVVYVLNKADLADPAQTEKWKRKLTGERSVAVVTNASASKSCAVIVTEIRRLCSEKISRYAAKGVKTSVKAMVLGVPNTGKSTIINNLIGKAKAITGNKAGVTRGKQWFKVNDTVEVLDTPGTLYPKLSDQTVARRLAYLGSIKDEVVDGYELAIELIRDLDAVRPDAITERYGFTPAGDGESDVTSVAKSRGFLLRGGDADLDRASVALIDDFRKGRLGRITLDEVSND